MNKSAIKISERAKLGKRKALATEGKKSTSLNEKKDSSESRKTDPAQYMTHSHSGSFTCLLTRATFPFLYTMSTFVTYSSLDGVQ